LGVKIFESPHDASCIATNAQEHHALVLIDGWIIQVSLHQICDTARFEALISVEKANIESGILEGPYAARSVAVGSLHLSYRAISSCFDRSQAYSQIMSSLRFLIMSIFSRGRPAIMLSCMVESAVLFGGKK
jgi:hypothetical protein